MKFSNVHSFFPHFEWLLGPSSSLAPARSSATHLTKLRTTFVVRILHLCRRQGKTHWVFNGGWVDNGRHCYMCVCLFNGCYFLGSTQHFVERWFHSCFTGWRDLSLWVLKNMEKYEKKTHLEIEYAIGRCFGGKMMRNPWDLPCSELARTHGMQKSIRFEICGKLSRDRGLPGSNMWNSSPSHPNMAPVEVGASGPGSQPQTPDAPDSEPGSGHHGFQY